MVCMKNTVVPQNSRISPSLCRARARPHRQSPARPAGVPQPMNLRRRRRPRPRVAASARAPTPGSPFGRRSTPGSSGATREATGGGSSDNQDCAETDVTTSAWAVAGLQDQLGEERRACRRLQRHVLHLQPQLAKQMVESEILGPECASTALSSGNAAIATTPALRVVGQQPQNP